MTDRAAIIERAARALCTAEYVSRPVRLVDLEGWYLLAVDHWRSRAEAVLKAVCPGLLDGTAWLAPWEATDGMMRAGTLLVPTWDDRVSAAKYAAMRDAHLSQSTQEPTP